MTERQPSSFLAPWRRIFARIALTGCVVLIAASSLWADAVLDWNAIAESTSVAAGAPPIRNRITAMAQVAVHDALNSIQPRYDSYASVPLAAIGASPDAAVAAAAYTVLTQTVPSQASALETLYDDYIAGLPVCPAAHPSCIDDGIAAGEAAANAMLLLRMNDGSDTPHLPYLLPPAPGRYQSTPPAFAPPQFAGWAHVAPFALNDGAQFRADASEIFDLTGDAYTRDYNEVKRVGSAHAETTGDRRPDQSAIARFWPGGGASWNAVTRVIVAGRGLDMWEHARLLALVNMALSDSGVTVFDTKYMYNFWRPVTAIRAGDTDGNPATAPDPTWLSYIPTPPYPDYTCGLPTNAGAAVEVLRRYFGTDDIAYTFTAGPDTRSFASLSQAEHEAVDARVFGGIHFRSGCDQGARQGEQVGRFVIQHSLRPLKAHGEH
jgi:hypothetical protein